MNKLSGHKITELRMKRNKLADKVRKLNIKIFKFDQMIYEAEKRRLKTISANAYDRISI